MRGGFVGRRGRRRIVGAALAALLGSMALASFIGSLARAQSASPSGAPIVLRVGTTVDLLTANPFGVSAGSDWSVVTAQYDMLLKFAASDLSPAPSLAKSCVPNGDSTVWTCTLREGLRWSDGSPLTSRDVAFSYRFVIDNKIPQYVGYFPFRPVFETPNDTTLIWRSQKPTFAPEMPPWVYVVPERIWKPYDGKGLRVIKGVENVPSVGSGPFVLTSWTRGQGWTLQRNPYYWGPRPTVDQIDYRLYTNQEAMIQALKNGEVDFVEGLKPSLFASVQGLPNVTVQKVVSDWWLNLAFNFGGQGPEASPLPALRDRTVRVAIEMAIDKQAIADKVYQGTAAPGDTVIRPASTYWHLDIPTDQEVPYDPTGARTMLDGAGYVDTNGDGVREDPKTGQPLELLVPASQDTTGAVEAGQLIVGFLKQIGIKVNLRPVTDAKMGDYWGAGNFDAYIWYWSGDPDPNYQLSVFTSGQCGGWSDGCWKDPAYDRLYQEQRGIMDRAARLKVVQEAQRYIYDQVPVVVLAYPGWLQAYRNDRFTGWVPAPGRQGYLLPTYNYDSVLSIRPVGASNRASSASSDLSGWFWVIAAGVIVAGSIWLVRRGRRRELDEG